MEKINRYKVFLVFVVFAALIMPAASIAKTKIKTFEGSIQGALCVLDGKKCPKDDLDTHLLIEADFMFLADDGQHYYLPNLSRSIKVRYAGRDVRASGKVIGESIIVDRFEVKAGGAYTLVWSKEKQKKEFINYFENLPMG